MQSILLPSSWKTTPCHSKLNIVSQWVQQYVVSLAEGIESNKSKLDMQRAIWFVDVNVWLYRTEIESLLQSEPSSEQQSFADTVKVEWFSDAVDVNLQLSPDECRAILARMPRILQNLSQIESVNYDYNGAGYRIHVPLFRPDGTFSRLAQAVRVEDFPRLRDATYPVFWFVYKEDSWHYEEQPITQVLPDHLTQLLVWISNGKTIFPSALPSTLWSSEAIKAYQTWVFLHEFFHTIDYPNRDPEKRKSIYLKDSEGKEFTFQDWWEEWEKLLLQSSNIKPVSFYASTYQHILNEEQKKNDSPNFTSAVAEQIAESFSGYFLGIQANSHGLSDFKSGYPIQWWMIDRLCSAQLAKDTR